MINTVASHSKTFLSEDVNFKVKFQHLPNNLLVSVSFIKKFRFPATSLHKNANKKQLNTAENTPILTASKMPPAPSSVKNTMLFSLEEHDLFPFGQFIFLTRKT